MNKIYSKINFLNRPSKKTPLNAANLNKMDEAIDELDNRVVDTNDALAVERARIDNLAKLPEGSTTGDAELIDGRVDYKGNTHTNIGEHIREVSSQLSSEIDEVSESLNALDNSLFEFEEVSSFKNFTNNVVQTSNTFYGLGNAFNVSGVEYITKIEAYLKCLNEEVATIEVMDTNLNVLATANQNVGTELELFTFDIGLNVKDYDVVYVGIRTETKSNLQRYGSTIDTTNIPTNINNGIYYSNGAWKTLETVSQTMAMVVYCGAKVLKSELNNAIQVGNRITDFLNNTSVATNSNKERYFCCYDVQFDSDKAIKELTVIGSTTENIAFAIGVIDQNNMLRITKEFFVKKTSLIDTFNLYDNGYVIGAGEMLFCNLKETRGLSIPNSGYETLHTVRTLTQDGTEETVNGYTGLVFKETDNFLPFYFTLADVQMDNKLENVEEELAEVKNNIVNPNFPISITNPNGDKFRLLLSADNGFVFSKFYPHKVFFFGNSLLDVTLRSGDNYYQIGMCASSNLSDYYANVVRELKRYDSGLVSNRRNFATWETATSTEERLNILNNDVSSLVGGDEDLIIIQVGDNVTSEAQFATFENDYTDLIKWFRSHCHNATVLCCGAWYTTESKQAIMKSCAEKMGVFWCDFSDYAKRSDCKGNIGDIQTIYDTDGVTVLATRELTSGGQASHPNDLGMSYIAQSILKTLNI